MEVVAVFRDASIAAPGGLFPLIEGRVRYTQVVVVVVRREARVCVVVVVGRESRVFVVVVVV